MFKEFKKFLLRGSIVDLAVGFTVGASFTSVAKSLVTDILMPPISYLLGQATLSELTYSLVDGEVTIYYGKFLDNVLALLVVALAMFALLKLAKKFEDQLENLIGKKEKKDEQPELKKCPYCFTNIPFKATRCSACTSKLKK